jgi:large subunit ribosomal protein L5
MMEAQEEKTAERTEKTSPGIMRSITIGKVTVNMGVGEPGERLENAINVMKQITGSKPVKTLCKIKQPGWGIREGLEIGTKITLRKKAASEFLKAAFAARQNSIPPRNFDRAGNFGFGVKEHIEMPDVKYDPKLGILGFDVLVTLERPGYRVKKRKMAKTKTGKNHRITKEEAISFVKENFGVEVA